MTKIALIAAPTPAPESDEPSLGQRDAELIVARLQMAELALAMESYPSAPPDSLVAQCEQQVRSAALEVPPPPCPCEALSSSPNRAPSCRRAAHAAPRRERTAS